MSDAGDTCATAKSLIVRAKPTYAVLSGYAVADWRPVEAFTLNAGARLDHFTNIGETPINPRLTLIVRPTCPQGVPIGMARPWVLLGAVRANSSGVATLSFSVPTYAAGKVYYFQVVDQIACVASNLVTETL